MPDARAAEMLPVLTGVQVRVASIRRQTYTAGVAYQAVQMAQAEVADEPADAGAVNKLVMSLDGAMVPQVAWAMGRSEDSGHQRGSRASGTGGGPEHAPVLLLPHE
jgi:hypothetical protein